jgi:hypothetical protein
MYLFTLISPISLELRVIILALNEFACWNGLKEEQYSRETQDRPALRGGIANDEERIQEGNSETNSTPGWMCRGMGWLKR